ncbi:MAG: hypothetical protein VCA38_11835 [Roseibacillus sp.]|jgi:ABC-type transport system involved in multi-copper enzyme maturation permease subunit
MNTLGILFLDSFRMLRSQKLFWIVLSLSGLVALVYASLGFNEKGLTLFFGLLPIEHDMLRAGDERSKELYLLLFTNTIVPFWLGLIAVVLALISCASIFPEFVAQGSIDLALSKPPRRITLFVGKYLGSLLFVFLQVFPFTVIVFLAFGFRFGEWSFSLFWAVPLVVLVFSLVYAMHVLVSVWSGSTVFGLLAAILIWGVSVMAEWSEDIIYQFAYVVPQAGLKPNWIDGGVDEVEPKDNAGEVMVGLHWFCDLVRTPLPKTRMAGNQMRRLIRIGGETDQLAGKSVLGSFLQSGEDPPQHAVEAEERADRRHPVWKDVGSSLFYELAVVGLASFIFCRRDY